MIRSLGELWIYLSVVLAVALLARSYYTQKIKPKRASGIVVQLAGTSSHKEVRERVQGGLQLALAQTPIKETVQPLNVWWLFWLQAHHWMLVGDTGSGKSTVARAMLYWFSKLGKVLIIDPHWREHHWCGLPAVGAGRNYDEINGCFLALERELDRRSKIYATLKRGEEPPYPNLVVFVDEMPTIMGKCDDAARVWKDLVREARKFDMHLVCLTTDPSVKSLGIEGEGASRKNLGKLLLGDYASGVMPWLRSHTYPAALDYKLPKPIACDTSTLVEVEQYELDTSVIWHPEGDASLTSGSLEVAALVTDNVITQEHVQVALLMLEYYTQHNRMISTRELAKRLYNVPNGGGTYSEAVKPIRALVEPMLEQFVTATPGVTSVTSVITTSEHTGTSSQENEVTGHTLVETT